MRSIVRCLTPVCLAAACSVSSDTDVDSPPPPAAGMVAGFVRDTAGRGIVEAVVCAVAGCEVNGTPVILMRQAAR